MVKRIQRPKTDQVQQSQQPQKGAKGKAAQEHAHLQAQKEALEQTQKILQTAQSQQVKKARATSKSTTTTTSAPSLTPQQLSTVRVPGATAAHAKAIQDSLNYLLAHAPAQYQGALHGIQVAFSQFHSAPAPYPKGAEGELSSYGKTLNAIAAHLTPAQQAQYRALLSADLKTSSAAIEQQIEKVQAQLQSDQASSAHTQEVVTALDQLRTFASQLTQGPADMQSLVKTVETLVQLIQDPKTSPDLVQTCKSALDDLVNLGGSPTAVTTIAQGWMWGEAQKYQGESKAQFAQHWRQDLDSLVAHLDPDDPFHYAFSSALLSGDFSNVVTTGKGGGIAPVTGAMQTLGKNLEAKNFDSYNVFNLENLLTPQTTLQSSAQAKALLSQFQQSIAQLSKGPIDMGNFVSVINQMMTLINDPKTPHAVTSSLRAALDNLGQITGNTQMSKSSEGNCMRLLSELWVWSEAQKYQGLSPTQFEQKEQADFQGVMKGAPQPLTHSFFYDWFGGTAPQYFYPQSPSFSQGGSSPSQIFPNTAIFTVNAQNQIEPNPDYMQKAAQAFQGSNLNSKSVTTCIGNTALTMGLDHIDVASKNSQITKDQQNISLLESYKKSYDQAASGDLNPPFTAVDNTPLPTALQPSVSTLVQEAKGQLQYLEQKSDPALKPLLDQESALLNGLKPPYTATALHQLEVTLQKMDGCATSLPDTEKGHYFFEATQLYGKLQVLAQDQASSVAAQLKSALGDQMDTFSVLQELQTGEATVQALQTPPLTASDLTAVGKNILMLIELQGSLPTSSPLYTAVTQRLNQWGECGLNSDQMGEAIWTAAVQKYTSGPDGSVQDFSQVERYLSALSPKESKEPLASNTGIHQVIASLAAIQTKRPPSWPGYAGKQPPPPADVAFSNGMVIPTFTAFQKSLAHSPPKIDPTVTNNLATTYSTTLAQTEKALGPTYDQAEPLSNTLNGLDSLNSFASRRLDFARLQIAGKAPQGSFLQKALAPLIQTEIDKMNSLLLMLKRYSSSGNQKQIAQLQKELQKISKEYPQMSTKSIQQLSSLMNQMNTLAGSLPNKSVRASYWNTESDLYGTLAKISDATVSNDAQINSALGDLAAILKNWEGGNASSEDVAKIAQDLQTLLENGTVLSYGDTKQLSTLLNEMEGIQGGPLTKGGVNASLGQAVTIELQNSLLNQYLAQPGGGGKNVIGFQNFVKNYIKALPNAHNPDIQKLENNLLNVNSIIASPTNPNPLFPLASYDPATGIFSYDPNTIEGMESGFTSQKPQPPSGGWENLISALQLVQKSFDPQTANISFLNNLTAEFQVMQKVTAQKATSDESLADLFRNAVLKNYMPGQEALLAKIASDLKFNNMAATDANDIMNILTNFTNAQNNYDFSSLLHGGSGGKYPGSAANAQAVLSNEISACKQDLTSIQKAYALIKQQMKTLENDHEFDDNPALLKAKNVLLGKLHGYLENLEQAQTQLSGKDGTGGLLGVLQSLKIGGDNNNFTVSSSNKDWQKDLALDENRVINGWGGTYPGGLLNIANMVKGDQQDYSNQSQTQQMQLQLTMTQIQQEWTIVATVLTTLNQAYMTIAQGIYK